MDLGFLQAWAGDGRAWVRLFGWGVMAKNLRRCPVLFSDRNRAGACVSVGPFLFRLLTPTPGAKA